MRPLFRSDSSRSRTGHAREVLGWFHPDGWGLIYWVALVVGGCVSAAYLAFRWASYFAAAGMWWGSVLIVGVTMLLVATAWLRVPLAAFLLAVVIGVGSAAFSGGIQVLLP